MFERAVIICFRFYSNNPDSFLVISYRKFSYQFSIFWGLALGEFILLFINLLPIFVIGLKSYTIEFLSPKRLREIHVFWSRFRKAFDTWCSILMSSPYFSIMLELKFRSKKQLTQKKQLSAKYFCRIALLVVSLDFMHLIANSFPLVSLNIYLSTTSNWKLSISSGSPICSFLVFLCWMASWIILTVSC